MEVKECEWNPMKENMHPTNSALCELALTPLSPRDRQRESLMAQLEKRCGLYLFCFWAGLCTFV